MHKMRQDPRLVTLSVGIYRRLVTIYPRPFRNEYARHMVQVFRDRSLATHLTQGATALPPLWAETLFDLVKTATEEHLQRGTTMTRGAFVRLSGWAMMVGVVLTVLTFAGLGDETKVRVMLYELLGAPTTASAYNQIQSISSAATLIMGLAGVGFLTIGLLGLQLRYGRQTGQLGELCLWISIGSGAVATFMIAAGTLGIELPWSLFSLSMVAMLLFLGLYGLIALRVKPMPHGNLLPLLAGLPLGLGYLFAIIANPAETAWLQAILLLPVGCLFALGFVLATSPAEENGPRQDALSQAPA